jgi:hypothetical protein
MKIYAPDGEVGRATTPLAALPERLSNQRILCLDNGKPGADRVLERLALGAAERTGAVYAGLVRKGSAATPCEDELLERIRSQADWVLTGTAD